MFVSDYYAAFELKNNNNKNYTGHNMPVSDATVTSVATLTELTPNGSGREWE